VKASYDVIVSGAGPAGSYAGYLCAKNGLRTLIVERKGLPREKCCAGGVLERSLRELDFPVPSSVVERDIYGTVLVHGDQRFEFRSPSRVAVTVRREVFDSFLTKRAEAAGAEVLTDHETVKVKEHPDRVTVSDGRSVRDARYLIIAEGVCSRSARQMLGSYPPEGLGIGMAAHCDFGSNPPDLLEFYLTGGRRPQMPFIAEGAPDGWMFPHQNGGNVGLAGRQVSTALLRKEMEKLIDAMGKAYGGVTSQGAVYAHPIPVKPRSRFSTGRCLVTGDAAGLASPMTGEGISYALSSGRLAAETVLSKAAMTYRPRDLRTYDAAVRGELLPVLRATTWVSRWFQSMTGIIDVRGPGETSSPVVQAQETQGYKGRNRTAPARRPGLSAISGYVRPAPCSR
jgi:geranylgeranyl reductase family protein